MKIPKGKKDRDQLLQEVEGEVIEVVEEEIERRIIVEMINMIEDRSMKQEIRELDNSSEIEGIEESSEVKGIVVVLRTEGIEMKKEWIRMKI